MKQMLIYDTVVPVTRDKHARTALKPTGKYDFARQTNSVPLVAGEFAMTAMHYAIVFGQGGGGAIPAALLGGRDNENVFIAADGSWSVPYVPAFIRRYPFVFGADEKNETFTLMIDESFEGLNESGKGERFFDADGEQTAFIKNTMSFLSEYQGQVQATQAFARKLMDLGLIARPPVEVLPPLAARKPEPAVLATLPARRRRFEPSPEDNAIAARMFA